MPKNADFLQKKMLTSAKLRKPRYWKVYFLKLHMCANLGTKFQVQVSSMILTSFRQEVILPPPPTSKRAPKKPTQIRVKTPSYRTPPGNCFCSTEKYFINKMVKNHLRKKKNANSLWEKQRHTHNKNLITIYINSSYHFIIQKFLYFSFLCFPWYIESTSF